MISGMRELAEAVQQLAVRAGDAILEIYRQEHEVKVTQKQDQSPLTAADLAAHHLLMDGLSSLTPDIPVLSEEGGLPDFAERSRWQEYWLLDPLDGTKEFLSRNGEFTVNLAFISRHRPKLGVVHVPVLGRTYAGFTEQYEKSAWRISAGKKEPIRARRLDPARLTLVASRRHGSQALSGLMQRVNRHFAKVQITNMGSSLKICLLAEGTADFYPRLAPTSEWDTAAAHAVLSAAGGILTDTGFEPLGYNQKADILNPSFLGIADPDYDWQEKLAGAL